MKLVWFYSYLLNKHCLSRKIKNEKKNIVKKEVRIDEFNKKINKSKDSFRDSSGDHISILNVYNDFVKLYYGLQLQLALYLNAAIELEQKRFQGKKVKPAGIFYYQIKDPMLNREDLKDEEHPEGELLKKLKMDLEK